MKAPGAVLMHVLLVTVATCIAVIATTRQYQSVVPVASAGGEVTCLSKGETTPGMKKSCYYDCLGSAAATTIDGTALCCRSHIKR